MSRNIVPRIHKGSDLGTSEKNWNKLYADAVILRGSDLKALLDGKTDLDTLTAKGDLYVATDAGVITRLPAGTDGYVLKTDSGDPKGLIWGPAGARQELTGDMTVTVGSGGNFPTINAALENIVALYYPKYISGGNCPRVTINLLSGFMMSEQILVESLDLSWITITGVDAETTINRSALTNHLGSGYSAFVAHNGSCLPVIGQLFTMDTSGDGTNRNGIIAISNSKAIVLSGCGVKNAGSNGIYAANSSVINASGADASGAGVNGVYAASSSTINANGANASGAVSRGIYADGCSTINASGANASGAGVQGVYAANSSVINASSVTASNIAIGNGSIINAYNTTATLSHTANTVTAAGIIFK